MYEATSVPIASTNTKKVFSSASTMISTCEKCNKEFSNPSNLNRHLREKHQNDNTNLINNYGCDLCDKKFKRRDHLKAHKDAVHLQGSVLQCAECSFKTYLKHVLQRHLLSHKKRIKQIQKNYKCTFCPMKYQTDSALKKHLRKKHECKHTRLNKKITSKKGFSKLQCHNCLFECHHCNSCFHEFTYSCTGNGREKNMCKHINVIETLQNKIGQNQSTEDTNFQKSVIEEISKKSNSKTNFFEDREKFLLDFSAIIREKVTNYEELEAVITHCKPIPLILSRMKPIPKSVAPAIIDNKQSTSKTIKQQKLFSTSKPELQVKEKRNLCKSCVKKNLEVQLMMGNQSHDETNTQIVVLDHDYCTQKTPVSQDL